MYECYTLRNDLTGRYAALVSVEAVRRDVLKKLLAMLLHPLPRVRLLIV